MTDPKPDGEDTFEIKDYRDYYKLFLRTDADRKLLIFYKSAPVVGLTLRVVAANAQPRSDDGAKEVPYKTEAPLCVSANYDVWGRFEKNGKHTVRASNAPKKPALEGAVGAGPRGPR